jgi:hypothetical protein
MSHDDLRGTPLAQALAGIPPRTQQMTASVQPSMPSRRGTRALGRGRAWVVFGATHSRGSCESSRWLSNPNCVVIFRSRNVISLNLLVMSRGTAQPPASRPAPRGEIRTKGIRHLLLRPVASSGPELFLCLTKRNPAVALGEGAAAGLAGPQRGLRGPLNQRRRRCACSLGVQSRSEVEWIVSESDRLVCPGFADVLIGRQTL